MHAYTQSTYKHVCTRVHKLSNHGAQFPGFYFEHLWWCIFNSKSCSGPVRMQLHEKGGYVLLKHRGIGEEMYNIVVLHNICTTTGAMLSSHTNKT